MRGQEGISHHLQRLLKYEILRPCQSAWNTPLLPVQKPGTNDYCPVQDLRAVSQAAVTLHPVVPNPYSLLALIPAEATCFLCLDLKDVFFYIQLAPVNQTIFALQWEDPPSQGANSSQPGPISHRASKILQPFLELSWHQICGHTQQRKLAALSSSQQLTTKTLLKGQSSYSIFYGKLDTKYLKRRHRSAKTKSNIWGSTSPKASRTSVQKENKLSARSQLWLQEDRSTSSWEWLCSARFGYLISHC
jgi:hypothetical protein